MSLILPGGTITELRGKLGSNVFRMRESNIQLMRQYRQVKFKHPNAQYEKGTFKTLQKAWAIIPEGSRTLWNNFAITIKAAGGPAAWLNSSGYNLFVAANLNCFQWYGYSNPAITYSDDAILTEPPDWSSFAEPAAALIYYSTDMYSHTWIHISWPDSGTWGLEIMIMKPYYRSRQHTNLYAIAACAQYNTGTTFDLTNLIESFYNVPGGSEYLSQIKYRAFNNYATGPNGYPSTWYVSPVLWY
jgi:hypothetical protein